MHKSEPDVLKNVALFDLNITLWSGRVKLYVEDLRNNGFGRLVDNMPEEVVNLGSKRIFPQASLRPFNSLKYNAEKILREKGFRSYSASIVPRSEIKAITAHLDGLRSQFYAEREDLKAGYLQRLYAWADTYAEWRNAILGAAPSAGTIYAKLRFEFRYYLLSGEDTVGESGGDNVAQSLIDELLEEIRSEAEHFWHESLKGRDRVPRRSLCRLQRISSKLSGFAFIDNRIVPMVSLVDRAIARVPAQGPITGHAYDAILSAVLLLLDPNREKAHGQAVIDGANDDDEASEMDVTDSQQETKDDPESPPQDEPGSDSESDESQPVFTF